MMYGAQLNWDLPWSRQKPERLCMAYSKVSSRFLIVYAHSQSVQIEQEVPELQRFENHWVSEFLMQESFQNHRTHAGAKQNAPEPSDASPRSAKPTKSTKPSKPSNTAKRVTNSRKVKGDKADNTDNDDVEDKNMSRPDSNSTQASGPYNDGETEIEEAPGHTDRDGAARETEDVSPDTNSMFVCRSYIIT